MVKTNMKRDKGFTFVEILVAMVFISILVLGTMYVRYNSVVQARQADVEITAARLAVLLLETWKGINGDMVYDPGSVFSPELTISADSGPPAPTGFLFHNSYRIETNQANFYVTLSYKDATTDEPKALNVCVAWLQGYGQGSVSNSDLSVKLTTYIENG